jgi:hypothetical protein
MALYPMYMQHYNGLSSYGANKSRPWRVVPTSCLGSTSTTRICETQNVKHVLLVLPFVQCQDSTYEIHIQAINSRQSGLLFKIEEMILQTHSSENRDFVYGSRVEMWSAHISRAFRSCKFSPTLFI